MDKSTQRQVKQRQPNDHLARKGPVWLQVPYLYVIESTHLHTQATYEFTRSYVRFRRL